jgi:hypothetical protein
VRKGGELVVLSAGVVVDLEDRGVSVPLTKPMRNFTNSLAPGLRCFIIGETIHANDGGGIKLLKVGFAPYLTNSIFLGI